MRRRNLLSAGGVSPDGITYKYVDMGLSVKWATFDIGATAVGEYGKYFQWGDIQGYTSSQVGSGAGQKYFYWSDYKYCNGSNTTLTKYNNKRTYGTVDWKTVLESSDDAATFNMGTGWRMPTEAEYTELKDACDYAWDSTNKCGILTLKTDSTKKLVFPNSGIVYQDKIVGQDPNAETSYFWLSSLDKGSPDNARSIHVFAVHVLGTDYRYIGSCVRGVWTE